MSSNFYSSSWCSKIIKKKKLRLSVCIFMHHTISCKIIRPWILGIENKPKNSWLTLWPCDSSLIIKFICCKLLALMLNLKLPACGCVVIHVSLEVWKFGTTEPWHNVMHSVWKDQLFQALINSLVCVCVWACMCVGNLRLSLTTKEPTEGDLLFFQKSYSVYIYYAFLFFFRAKHPSF